MKPEIDWYEIDHCIDLESAIRARFIERNPNLDPGETEWRVAGVIKLYCDREVEE